MLMVTIIQAVVLLNDVLIGSFLNLISFFVVDPDKVFFFVVLKEKEIWDVKATEVYLLSTLLIPFAFVWVGFERGKLF